jgi:hypothetical protein
MADSISVANLLALIRLDAEIPGDSTHEITDANLLKWVNLGVKRLTGKIYKWNKNWKMSSSTIALTGTELYNLPSTWYKPAGIFLGTAPDMVRLYPISVADRDIYSDSNTWDADAVYYLVGDTQIGILPAATTGTLTINFRPNATALASGGADYNGMMGWEDWICKFCAARYYARQAEWDAAREMKADMREIEDDIKSEVAKIDGTGPRSMERQSNERLLRHTPWMRGWR